MREWTIIVASAGAIAVAAVSFPLLGGYAARGTHGELVERDRQNALQNGDPDKRTFIYGCLSWPGAQSSNRAAQYGGNARLVDTSPDGTLTFEVDRWLAVEGPDIVRQRLTYSTKDDAVISQRLETLAEGPPDVCLAMNDVARPYKLPRK